ncbi:hypothetical protein [Cytobacillus depressus]|uniref:hypothetical protein n=1 Tax=Cytobacillus depressus TaxID=1602942 RepID=UPI0014797A07|nr:hypothetical protein [Cytobacillus depressus]
MVLLLITTIGMIISLGIVGSLLFFFTNEALNKEDSHTIDPIPNTEGLKENKSSH